MTNTAVETLPFLSSKERLEAYQLILDGCHHIWSKNEIQQEKAKKALEVLIPLTKNDPYFLAHLTSYVFKKSDAKDLQVFLAYAATLSSADGMPFSPGSKYLKPNLRYVGVAALESLDPKLVDRIVKVANMKYGVANYLNDASHFPMNLRTAIKKYVKYREAHPEYVAGIKKAGLASVLKRLYAAMRMKPSEEVVKTLRWKRKDIKVDFGERPYDFTGKKDLEIAEIIRANKIPYLGVLAELSRVKNKVSPVIAVAMLEQATGNQAVIMRATFEDAGILSEPEVLKLYEEKIKEAKTTLDRVDAISENASQAIKDLMKKARATQRQSQTVGIGKIYIHVDDSGSMSQIREFAADHGSIFAECVNDPAKNLKWGIFGSSGQEMPLPQEFVTDAFKAVIFSYRDGGSTDCYALYPNARAFGADVDVFISDQGHTDGDLTRKIREYHRNNPDVAKPRACVIINFGGAHYGSGDHQIKEAYEANGIPAVEMKPTTLKESALVVEAVKTALLGPVTVIDDIMNTELLKLPQWYYSV